MAAIGFMNEADQIMCGGSCLSLKSQYVLWSSGSCDAEHKTSYVMVAHLGFQGGFCRVKQFTGTLHCQELAEDRHVPNAVEQAICSPAERACQLS